MYADVLLAVRRTSSIDRVIIVTKDQTALRIASGHNITVLDDRGSSHSESAAQGISAAIALGATRVVLVAGDCPMLKPQELEDLLNHPVAAPRSALIVPDRHGTGTNALLISPPDALTPSFGEGSCERHFELARQQGATPEVVSVPTLALDVDTAEDFEELREMLPRYVGGAAHTRGMLAQLVRSGL
jgi:2-phospho-L-lactate/phosphoenolpyruvate guanylyltransferase